MLGRKSNSLPHAVTAAAGGAGAVREVCELLLQGHGKWDLILKKYEVIT